MNVVVEKGGFVASVKEVSVGKGEHVDNVDFALKSQDEGAIVTGTITNYSEVAGKSPDGVPLPYYSDSD